MGNGKLLEVTLKNTSRKFRQKLSTKIKLFLTKKITLLRKSLYHISQLASYNFPKKIKAAIAI